VSVDLAQTAAVGMVIATRKNEQTGIIDTSSVTMLDAEKA
jgi:hypothetical protein